MMETSDLSSIELSSIEHPYAQNLHEVGVGEGLEPSLLQKTTGGGGGVSWLVTAPPAHSQ